MSNKKKFNNKKKSNKNNKKRRLHFKEIQKNNKTSEKLIYDAELGLDMNTLLKNNMTIADLEYLSTQENKPIVEVIPKESFIPLSDFLTPEACEKLLPKEDGFLEVACTTSSETACTTHNESTVDTISLESTLPTDEIIVSTDEKDLTSSLYIQTKLKIEPKLEVVKTDLASSTEYIKSTEELDSSSDNTVISFPVENTAQLQNDIERKKFELNKYLEEEEKFKAFDKKLVTLTREKLPQKKKTGFSKFLDRLFV